MSGDERARRPPPGALTPVDVYKAGRLAAQMWRTEENVVFRYTSDYVDSTGPAVAFTLPVNDTAVHTDRLRVPPFFAGLLPEGDSRRREIQRAYHLAEDDELGLLAVVGADTVGDVQIVPVAEPLPPDPSPINWEEVSFAALWRDLAGLRTRSGLPGIQPKMSARSRSLHGGAVGALILKFPISGWHGVLRNEQLFMSAASTVGLRAAQVAIVTDAEGAEALAVDRFDRSITADGQLVRHAQEDASQILGLRPGQKYDPDARTVLYALADRCDAPTVAARDLFHQLVYAYIIGNNDLHAKNLLIRQDPISALWSVSPVYDALHTWPYEGDHRFIPAIRPDGPHDTVSLKWWLELAVDILLPTKSAQRIIGRVTSAAEALIARAQATDGLSAAQRRDIRRVLRKRVQDLSGDAD